MGSYGQISLNAAAPAAFPLPTSGYSRLLLRADNTFYFTANKGASDDNSSAEVFLVKANALMVFADIVLKGNLADTIWINSNTTVVVYYALT